MPDKKSTNEPLIEKLLSNCEERGRKAALRRFWSPTARSLAYPVLGRLGVPHFEHPDAYTAALYSIGPRHQAGGKTVGSACLQLAGGSIKAAEFETFEPHMIRLLASKDLSEVSNQLRKILIRCERSDISLNYNQLLWDLRKWPKQSEDVKTKWAMCFWQAPIHHLNEETAET
ncbi:MAG: type I-E CRISPR-associated protein Cse2/CasB [Opitutales bacterium]